MKEILYNIKPGHLLGLLYDLSHLEVLVLLQAPGRTMDHANLKACIILSPSVLLPFMAEMEKGDADRQILLT